MKRKILLLFVLLPLFVSCASNSPQKLRMHLKSNETLYKKDSFVALQYFAGILNRRVKVYILDDRLSVATVGGLLAAPFIATEAWL